MLAAVEHNLAVVDVFIGCAAVADYKVKNPVKTKIKKSDFEELKLELIKNPDILERVGRSKSRPKLVIGFAAEEENLIPNSLKKLKEKNCDLVVGNYLRGGEIFGSNETEVVMVDKNHSAKEELRKITKEQLAKELVLKIATLL